MKRKTKIEPQVLRFSYGPDDFTCGCAGVPGYQVDKPEHVSPEYWREFWIVATTGREDSVEHLDCVSLARAHAMHADMFSRTEAAQYGTPREGICCRWIVIDRSAAAPALSFDVMRECTCSSRTTKSMKHI